MINPRRAIAYRRRVRGQRPPGAPAPFVCGAGRSGTTLVRLMLDAHPELAIPSETHFVPELIEASLARRQTAESLAELITSSNRWGDFHLEPEELTETFRGLDPLTAADAIRAFFELYAGRQGKPRWGDKTPGYVERMRMIERTLPEARFVHVVRDGRDVALSLLSMNWGPDTVEKAAKRWRRRIRRARRAAPRVEHYIEVRFEDVVADTEAQLRRICEFVELEFDPAMLRYHERAEERLAEKARDLHKPGGAVQPAEARMQSHKLAKEPPRVDHLARWRTQMTDADRETFERIAGGLLSDLGYPVGAEAAQAASAAREAQAGDGAATGAEAGAGRGASG